MAGKGIDKNGKEVFIEEAINGEEYYCPCCGGILIPKLGEINVHHFAHKNLMDCDDFTQDMSEWHIQWQKLFPLRNREVPIEWNGEKHRADVLACGYVIEFQHSPISSKEFIRRNDFYTKAGKHLIWVFDFRDEYNIEYLEANDSGDLWSWKYAKRFMRDFIPQWNNNITIFFQLNDDYIYRVSWAIQKNSLDEVEFVEGGDYDYDYSKFKRFYTDMKLNANEFKKLIINREL